MNLTHEKSWYARKWSMDVLVDIIGGIFIAVGTYNFAAAAEFPVVGLNGIALIFYHLFGWPIGRVALILNIPIALFCFRILGRNFFLRSVRTSLLLLSWTMQRLCSLYIKATACWPPSAPVSFPAWALP